MAADTFSFENHPALERPKVTPREPMHPGYTPTFGVAYGGLSGETYWYQHTDVWRDELLMKYVPHFAVEPTAMTCVEPWIWLKMIHVSVATPSAPPSVSVPSSTIAGEYGRFENWLPMIWML